MRSPCDVCALVPWLGALHACQESCPFLRTFASRGWTSYAQAGGATSRRDPLVDLGCGDGRLLKLAVTDFNASSAIGYEMDPGLANTARSICGFDSRITIHERDAFEAEPSLATADVVALYLTESGNTKLLPMLRRALTKPGARVVSYVWGLGKDVPPTSTARLSGEGVVLAIGQPNILRWDRTDLHCPRTVAA